MAEDFFGCETKLNVIRESLMICSGPDLANQISSTIIIDIRKVFRTSEIERTEQ